MNYNSERPLDFELRQDIKAIDNLKLLLGILIPTLATYPYINNIAAVSSQFGKLMRNFPQRPLPA